MGRPAQGLSLQFGYGRPLGQAREMGIGRPEREIAGGEDIRMPGIEQQMNLRSPWADALDGDQPPRGLGCIELREGRKVQRSGDHRIGDPNERIRLCGGEAEAGSLAPPVMQEGLRRQRACPLDQPRPDGIGTLAGDELGNNGAGKAGETGISRAGGQGANCLDDGEERGVEGRQDREFRCKGFSGHGWRVGHDKRD